MTTDLAVREYTDHQLRQRIELNKQAGYGLDKANPAQLNIVFLLCQRYDLDPVSDITLFEGRPFITIDGRLRLLRRHPEYRGYSCHPLKREEKIDWGYEPDDIVVECVIRTTTWGEISARGKVTALEVQQARERAERDHRRPAPIGVHPVEIAEKRAIARAERAAFGQEAVLDEDEVQESVTTIIEERKDPERIARGAAEYERIFPANYGEGSPGRETAAPVESEAPVGTPPPTGVLVTSKTDPAWKRWLEVEREVRKVGLDVDTSGVKLGEVTDVALEASIADLMAAVDEARADG